MFGTVYKRIDVMMQALVGNRGAELPVKAVDGKLDVEVLRDIFKGVENGCGAPAVHKGPALVELAGDGEVLQSNPPGRYSRSTW